MDRHWGAPPFIAAALIAPLAWTVLSGVVCAGAAGDPAGAMPRVRSRGGTLKYKPVLRRLFTLAAVSVVMCLAIDAARSADGCAEFN